MSIRSTVSHIVTSIRIRSSSIRYFSRFDAHFLDVTPCGVTVYDFSEIPHLVPMDASIGKAVFGRSVGRCQWFYPSIVRVLSISSWGGLFVVLWYLYIVVRKLRGLHSYPHSFPRIESPVNTNLSLETT